jgi:hypothetical protein
LTPWIAPLVCTCILNPRASPIPYSTRIVQIVAVSKPGEDVILRENGPDPQQTRPVPHTLLISDGTTSIVAHLSPIARDQLQQCAARDGGALGPGTLLRIGGHRCVVVDALAPKVLPQPRIIATVQHQLPVPPRNNSLFHTYAALEPGRAVEAVFLDVYFDVVVLGQGPRLPPTTNVLDVIDVRRALQEADAAAARKGGTAMTTTSPGDPTIADVQALFSLTRGGSAEEQKEAEAERDELWYFISTVRPLVPPSFVAAEPANVPAAASAPNPLPTNHETVVAPEEEEQDIIVVVDDDDGEEDDDMCIGNMLIEEHVGDGGEIPHTTAQDLRPPQAHEFEKSSIDTPYKILKDLVESHRVSTPTQPSEGVNPTSQEFTTIGHMYEPQESVLVDVALVDVDEPLPETQPLFADRLLKPPSGTVAARSPVKVVDANLLMPETYKDTPEANATAERIVQATASSTQLDQIDLSDQILATQPSLDAAKNSYLDHPLPQSSTDAVDNLTHESAETAMGEDQDLLETQPPISATKMSRTMHPSQSTLDAVNDMIHGADDPGAAESKKRTVERPALPPGQRPKKVFRLGGDALRSLFMMAH